MFLTRPIYNIYRYIERKHAVYLHIYIYIYIYIYIFEFFARICFFVLFTKIKNECG